MITDYVALKIVKESVGPTKNQAELRQWVESHFVGCDYGSVTVLPGPMTGDESTAMTSGEPLRTAMTSGEAYRTAMDWAEGRRSHTNLYPHAGPDVIAIMDAQAVDEWCNIAIMCLAFENANKI